MKTNEELRNLSCEKLQEELLSLRREQFNLRMKKASGTLDKTDTIRSLRRNVAVVKTLLTQKAGN